MNIELNGISWNVKFVSHNNEHMIGSNGFCSYESTTIYIARDMPRDKIRRTLIHELTHAVEYSYGLRDRKSDDVYEDLANFVMYYGDLIIRTVDDIMFKVNFHDNGYDNE